MARVAKTGDKSIKKRVRKKKNDFRAKRINLTDNEHVQISFCDGQQLIFDICDAIFNASPQL